MAIKLPPALLPFESMTGPEIAAHQRYSRIVDEKGRYLPFDEFRHRVSGQDNLALAWSLTRHARNAAIEYIEYFNVSGDKAGFVITPAIVEACELVDKHTTGSALDEIKQQLRGAGAELASLQLDEPITSSQLEGANTTTLVAKNMLETGRAPATEDEHMIAGNARLMLEIAGNLDEPLTVALIRHFHAAGMKDINDEKYRPGELRLTDDIVIADYNGDIVHQPPPAGEIGARLESLCDWVNSQHSYIHPLVRAIILHFMLAHEHPFRDGNGRTSRALFYWLMLKNGYDVFRYISISSLLHAAPVKYAHSYQYTESDGMDLTYFIEYQAGIVRRAALNLRDHIKRAVTRSAKIDALLYQSGSLKRLTSRQVTLVNIMLAERNKTWSVAQVRDALGTSDNTARADLRALVKEEIAAEITVNGQKTLYQLNLSFS